ncbi:unannotated protein [freshwater metagenome]|uniref:Unannotated protein n=1 Tax=freshwater metagenome TaxID=449393 RepID=A0A6J7RAJ9_9ZZZZ
MTIDDAEATFAALADHIIDGLLARDPVTATSLGDHRFDDRLPDLSEDGLSETLHTIDQALSAVDQVDDLALDVSAAVDLEILRARLAAEQFALETLVEHTWNPLVANPGTALHLLLSRDFAPVEERLASLAGRLAGIPEALETSRLLLRDMPRVHVETAVGQFRGTLGMVRAEVDAALVSAPGMRRVVEPVQAEALGALEAHVGWLQDRLESDLATRDPRLGAEKYAAKLWSTLDAQVTPDELLHRAETDLVRIEGEIARVAADYLGEPVPPPDDAAVLVRRALDAVAADGHVNNDTVLPMCRSAFEATTAFVRRHDLVTIHDDPVEIVVMPEIHRGVAVAYCDPPGPLETAMLPTFFAISPTPAEWDDGRITSFFREYNAHMLHNLTVHEAMPGHVLQLAHAKRGVKATRVRSAFWSGPFVEGWAVYAEQLMVERGYDAGLGPREALAIHLQQLKMQLRMTINAILDVRVHSRGMTEVEGMRLMQGRGHQEEGEAVGKWRRALLSSTQLSTYYVGYVAVMEIVADLRAAHPTWTDRQVHDAVLSHGSPPPRHLRTLLAI